MSYLKSITLTNEDLIERLSGHKTLSFKQGVNVVIGPNGSGKTTLLGLLEKGNKLEGVKLLTSGKKVKYYKMDFEKDNPRIKSYLPDGAESSLFQLNSHFISHGETVRSLLKSISTDQSKGMLLIMDEPDLALDVKGMHTLILSLKQSKASQIIIAAHSPFLILENSFNIIELVNGYKQELIDWARFLSDYYSFDHKE